MTQVDIPPGMTTLTAVERFKDLGLEGVLARLRSEHIALRPEVCIERARLVTRFLRDGADPAESMEITYARAVAHFLAHKQPLFPDDNLLAGTTTSKPCGAPVYPELTGLAIWPELDTISTRKANPQKLSPEDAQELNLEIFPYWMDRSILERARAAGAPRGLSLFERIVFFIASKAGTISHTVPCYTHALARGVDALIAEAAEAEQRLLAAGVRDDEGRRSVDFYRAVQIALGGLLTYARNLAERAAELARHESDPWRRSNLEAMAAVCRQVPAGPARTFREAINSLWLIQVGIHAESINMAMSPGRLDQVLWEHFRRDLEAGRLSHREALQLVGCLWLKLNDNRNLVPETAEELFGGAGTVPAVTLGGVDASGGDAVNELTCLMLRATELLKTRDPSVNARYHPEINSRDYLRRVAEVIASTHAVPAIYNDAQAIRTLENQGVSPAHARDWAVIGCVELGVAGRSYDASSSLIVNLVGPLELALYNGRRPVTGEARIGLETGEDFGSFEELRGAFEAQLRWVVEQAIELNECLGRIHQQYLPTPLLSAFFEGPLAAGKDLVFGGALYNSSGATHVGFADTVDSLAAIEQVVFVERKVTFRELVQALRANFEGNQELLAYLRNRAPKFGTDHPVARRNADWLTRLLFTIYQAHVNYRGGRYRPAYWTMTNHAGLGKLSGALPNGRLSGIPFASGITPVSQAAQDLTTCLRAVGSLDPLCIPGGAALNLKYPALEGKSPADLDRFCAAVEAYFRCGGLHIQFNIMSYEMLLEARAHPERYPELLVRVSGYSAYFNDLNEAMKDEIHHPYGL